MELYFTQIMQMVPYIKWLRANKPKTTIADSSMHHKLQMRVSLLLAAEIMPVKDSSITIKTIITCSWGHKEG